MVEEQMGVVELREDFYRDSFSKVIIAIIGFSTALFVMIFLAIYLYIDQPPPIDFKTYEDFRVQAPVPVDKPYLSIPDLLQWVTNTIQSVFVFDFLHYNEQLKAAMPYFTDDGWKVFLNQLNTYADNTSIMTNKQFVNVTIAGSPFIVNQSTGPQSLLAGRWSWWVQLPITLNYFSSYNRSYSQSLTLQILVVRVSTLNNLDGVGIDNVIVVKNPTSPLP